MTTLGGIGHTLPFLIPSFWTAMVVPMVRGGRGTGGDLLGPLEIHGHPATVGDAAGRIRRRPGVRLSGS
jgi:hypothetical protein